MIHPEEVNDIAEVAYELFREKYPQEPEWKDLPPTTQFRWIDTVKGADRMRKGGSEIFTEQCALKAIEIWETSAPESSSPIASEPTLTDAVFGLFRGKGAIKEGEDADN